jgi:hypothetical protein
MIRSNNKESDKQNKTAPQHENGARIQNNRSVAHVDNFVITAYHIVAKYTVVVSYLSSFIQQPVTSVTTLSLTHTIND